MAVRLALVVAFASVLLAAGFVGGPIGNDGDSDTHAESVKSMSETKKDLKEKILMNTHQIQQVSFFLFFARCLFCVGPVAFCLPFAAHNLNFCGHHLCCLLF